MKDLSAKIVLITGAAGGFGSALARLLLREGSALILADQPGAPLRAAAEGAARAAAQAPGRIIGFASADLSAPEGAAQLHAAVGRISPRIDILVNNAGVGVYGRIDHIPAEKWERVMQVNLLAPMRLTGLVLPQLIAQGSGHIVNICSAASLVGAPGLGVYSASKFGLRGFTESLARDVGRHGIDVTGIYPFFAHTPILRSEQFGLQGPPASVPRALIGDPERIMAALVRGIKRRRRHIYPTMIARAIDLLRRLGG
jgi:NAD(P)-dependent dehydrogenase (short-subunit alcohol dehydrogenase family)